jgi:hypothetical protein
MFELLCSTVKNAVTISGHPILIYNLYVKYIIQMAAVWGATVGSTFAANLSPVLKINKQSRSTVYVLHFSSNSNTSKVL